MDSIEISFTFETTFEELLVWIERTFEKDCFFFSISTHTKFYLCEISTSIEGYSHYSFLVDLSLDQITIILIFIYYHNIKK